MLRLSLDSISRARMPLERQRGTAWKRHDGDVLVNSTGSVYPLQASGNDQNVGSTGNTRPGGGGLEALQLAGEQRCR